MINLLFLIQFWDIESYLSGAISDSRYKEYLYSENIYLEFAKSEDYS